MTAEPLAIEDESAGMSERTSAIWQAALLSALGVYVVSLFLNWWNVTVIGKPPFAANINGLANKLGELCLVLAVVAFVASLQAMRSSQEWLHVTRRYLPIALFAFNAVAIAITWRDCYYPFELPVYYKDSHLAGGAYLSIVASIVVLLAALVLDAGGLRALARRT